MLTDGCLRMIIVITNASLSLREFYDNIAGVPLRGSDHSIPGFQCLYKSVRVRSLANMNRKDKFLTQVQLLLLEINRQLV